MYHRYELYAINVKKIKKYTDFYYKQRALFSIFLKSYFFFLTERPSNKTNLYGLIKNKPFKAHLYRKRND